MTQHVWKFVGILAASASLAHAGFVGLPVELEYHVEDQGTTYYSAISKARDVDDTLTGTPEFRSFPEEPVTFDVNLSNDEIFISNFSVAGAFDVVDFNGLRLAGADGALANFSTVTVLQSSLLGLTADRVRIDDPNRLSVNWQVLAFTPLTTVTLGVTFGDSTTPSPSVPAPSAALTGAALLLLALRRRGRVAA